MARSPAQEVAMSCMQVGPTPEAYALARTPEEYERLRAQARVWEAATGRLLDRVGLVPGARCLDAGCGPGETMRLLAQRVGAAGQVLGIDVDRSLATLAEAGLHAAGHRQCAVRVHDLTRDEPIPEGPFDLVTARLLLFHLPQRVAVLRRLWQSVAPGGCLILQDYDLTVTALVPSTTSVDDILRVLAETFTAMSCDVRAGTRLPALMREAGIGAPDGTDVAGRLDLFAVGRTVLEQTFRSVLPAAIAYGVTTTERAEATLAALDRDAATHAERPLLWPLMLGAWKRKEP
jgi:2-polyprenyl-3-methyl-5-hydroxy-6-metoxy-1,4-benzoquinol methylase